MPKEKKIEKGYIKYFNSKRGFGFITPDKGNDIFVHISDIKNGKALNKGDRVLFGVKQGKKGLQAENVILIEINLQSRTKEKKENHYQCNGCKEIFLKRFLIKKMDDEFYCRSCFNLLFSTCSKCGSKGDKILFYNVGEEFFCRECWNQYLFVCSNCSEVFPLKKKNYIIMEEKEYKVCDICFSTIEGEEKNGKKICTEKYYKGIKPYKFSELARLDGCFCDICGKEFSNKAGVQIHKSRIH